MLTQNKPATFFLLCTVLFLVLWLTKKGPKKMSIALGPTPYGLTALCIDLRFQDEMQDFFDHYFGDNRFDNFILPGPGLALVGVESNYNAGTQAPTRQVPGGLASANYMTAWASVAVLARVIHGIVKLAIMDHEDCGYFANYFDGTRSMYYIDDSGTEQFYPSNVTYDSLTGRQQMQVSSYYLEQCKTLWATELFPTTNGPSDLTTAVGYSTASLGGTTMVGNVQIHSFFIYKNGTIIETGSPVVVS
jgi:hypothetical protein